MWSTTSIRQMGVLHSSPTQEVLTQTSLSIFSRRNAHGDLVKSLTWQVMEPEGSILLVITMMVRQQDSSFHICLKMVQGLPLCNGQKRLRTSIPIFQVPLALSLSVICAMSLARLMEISFTLQLKQMPIPKHCL